MDWGASAVGRSDDARDVGESQRRVLIVDDEPNLLRMLDLGLAQHGFIVDCADSGAAALNMLHENEPDLVVLDLLMPDMDGFEVCRRIRRISSVPVIMLTALRNEQDVLQGLDAGADEYVTKPFSLAELSARIRAILRRVELDRPAGPPNRQFVLNSGRLVIDLARRTVTRDGQTVPLSATEFRLLSFLLARSGRVVSHAEILEHVWGPQYVQQSAYLRTYVGMLRRKIEEDPQNPQLIVSSHGMGYVFQDQAGLAS